MDDRQIDKFYQASNRKINAIKLDYKRSLYSEINWNNRLIGIKGPRGVGKTTLILQHIKESFEDRSKVLYVSLDNLWFASNSLGELVEYHYSHGGTHIFLDEIHRYKYEEWQGLMKNIYDDYPELRIVYTGSSMLQMEASGGDLSRRLRVYDMPGMSFREYLAFEKVLDYRILSLEEILSDHVNICSDIASSIRILPHFERYLKCGYYPFYKEDGDGFEQRLQEVARQIIEYDLPAVEDVEFTTIQKAKKMLMILAVQVPFVPNMTLLYQELETNREQGLKILYALEKGGLLGLLRTKVKALKHLSAPDKIFLDNTNLMYAVSDNVDIGNMRETFFWNQLSRHHVVNAPAKGDFEVSGKYLFEVGGRKKSFEQIKDVKDSYLAIDQIEIGNGNKIPLWLFGFLY